jgi:hypothetical protein
MTMLNRPIGSVFIVLAAVGLVACETIKDSLNEAADVYGSTRRYFQDRPPSRSQPSADASRPVQKTFPAQSASPPLAASTPTQQKVNTPIPPNPVASVPPTDSMQQSIAATHETASRSHEVCILAGEPIQDSTTPLVQLYANFSYRELYWSGIDVGDNKPVAVNGQLEALILAGTGACLLGEPGLALPLFRRVLQTNPELQVNAGFFPEVVLTTFEQARHPVTH